jgi:hypothetical protein
MRSPSSQDQPRSLLLVTRNNRADLEDFYAITGADTSRRIDNVVLLATAGPAGALSQHSLLVDGHFDAAAIFKSAAQDQATTQTYHGLSILALPALAREADTPHEVRWLAILGSDIAVFGSPASVQQELNRYCDKSEPDPLLIERLGRLGREQDAWSLIPSPRHDDFIPRVLGQLDPRLGAVAHQGESMQYGIHFGKHVEITASANADTQPETDQPFPSKPLSPPALASSFLSRSLVSAANEPVTVKVSRRRYQDWLARYSQGGKSNPAH